MRKQKVGVVQQAIIDLKKLEAESASALDIVTRTIDNLSNTNNKIDDKVAEIETLSAGLADAAKNMQDIKKKNSSIISKFQSLIS